MVRLRALLTFMGIVWAMTAQASMILILWMKLSQII